MSFPIFDALALAWPSFLIWFLSKCSGLWRKSDLNFFLPDSLRVEDFLHQDVEFHKFTIFSGMQLRTESAASGSFHLESGAASEKFKGAFFFLFGHDYRLFCLAWQKARSDTT